MPTNLTLTNIPDHVYQQLKASAEAHRRSLSSEAIVCLESVLVSGRVSVGERLAAARVAKMQATRQKLCATGTPPMTAEEIEAEIQAHRAERRRAAGA